MMLIQGLETELFIFLLAICTHVVLFGNYKKLIGCKKTSGKKGHSTPSNAKNKSEAKPSQFSSNPALTRSIERLIGAGSEAEQLMDSLKTKLGDCSPNKAVEELAGLIDSLGKEVSPGLLTAVRGLLQDRNLPLDVPIGEALLRGYFHLTMMPEFYSFLGELEAEQLEASSISILAMKAALRMSDLDMALVRLRQLQSVWGQKTSSHAPEAILRQLVRMAAKKSSLFILLSELADLTLSPEILNYALSECVHHGDEAVGHKAEQIAHANGLVFSGALSAALIRCYHTKDDSFRLLQEATNRNDVKPEILVAVVNVAGHLSQDEGAALVEAALTHLNTFGSLPLVAAAFLQFYAGLAPNLKTNRGSNRREPSESVSEGSDEDCATRNRKLTKKESEALLDVYERHFACVSLPASCAEVEWLVMEAAIRCDRKSTLQKLMAAVTEHSKQASLIKSFGIKLGLRYAKAIFEACPEKLSCIYNSLLDVCVECCDTKAAEDVMHQATKAACADVVTYNTLIKAHLRAGNPKHARAVIETMRSVGLQPNCVTFNELLDATIKHSPRDTMLIIREMQECGLKPNHITGSILLKNIQPNSRFVDIEQTLAVIDSMDDEMDEVLLSSLLEACIRLRRTDLLMHRLQLHRSEKKVQIKGPHTYGSLIRACGYVRDMQGVWDTWREMRMRHILPTSVTMGCMVEALVTNGDVEGGYELIHEIEQDAACSTVVNAIIYCSVLKGFSHQKNFDRVWSIYQEMLSKRKDFSIVTYNTLVDACSRCGEVSHIPILLKDMTKLSIEPNLITYSAILKGYCAENKLDKAFELYESMLQTTKFRPDEIMYNSLLDGCARQGLYERGMQLLEEMQKEGVSPSNFTLSVLVKLATRSNRLEKAFELCEDISKKYHFKLNVHVFNNLIQGCIAHKDLPRAMGVLQRMVHERVRLDVRTYSLLLKAHIFVGELSSAAGILRAALGLADVHSDLANLSAKALQPDGGLPKPLVTEVLEGIKDDEALLFQLLQDFKHQLPSFNVDPKLKLRVTTSACRQPPWRKR